MFNNTQKFTIDEEHAVTFMIKNAPPSKFFKHFLLIMLIYFEFLLYSINIQIYIPHMD